MTPAPTELKAAPSGVVEALRAGWNACRKSIYAVCEDVDREAEETYLKASSGGSATSTEGHLSEFQSGHVSGYRSGMVRAAKSIARGFNSMEALDDDNVRTALAAIEEQAGRRLPTGIDLQADEKLGELIYRAMYEHEGGKWAAVETRYVWLNAAARLRAMLSVSPKQETE